MGNIIPRHEYSKLQRKEQYVVGPKKKLLIIREAIATISVKQYNELVF